MEDFGSRSHGCARTIFTIGHSTRTLAQLIALLREARIELLVDVRSVPRSRTNPQFNIDIFPEALAWLDEVAKGIAVKHLDECKARLFQSAPQHTARSDHAGSIDGLERRLFAAACR
jgi:Protein of unknown function, DUF488